MCEFFGEPNQNALEGVVANLLLSQGDGQLLAGVRLHPTEKLRIKSYVDASWAVTCYGGHITFGMGGVLDFKFARI